MPLKKSSEALFLQKVLLIVGYFLKYVNVLNSMFRFNSVQDVEFLVQKGPRDRIDSLIQHP